MASIPGISTPPAPPPKTGSHETSRMQTPNTNLPPRPPPHPAGLEVYHGAEHDHQYGSENNSNENTSRNNIEDPGEGWLPEFLADKSYVAYKTESAAEDDANNFKRIQDLSAILSSTELLASITHAPETIHPSLSASHQQLLTALNSNTQLAHQLTDLESRLSHQRSATQAQLLSTHSLERTWRTKQADVDNSLAPFSPSALYQVLAQAVTEQGQVCQAMEESFLEAEGGEAEVADWVRRYREARVLYYLRQERKERWDEGRVGGWR